jgi:hypothetical protein
MNLNAELGHALGMPPNCRKLVLTLEAGKVPRIEYEFNLRDSKGAFVIERDDEGIPQRVAALRFMVRLEPFSPE